MKQNTSWTWMIVLAALAWPAWAEKADRDKPVNVEADTAHMDDIKKLAIYEGKVVLTQGTLRINAQRLEVQQDAEGFSTGDATGAPAYFREKMEGSEEHVEGWARRVEYDGRGEKVRLTGAAHVKRGIDDLRGEVVIYDQKSGQYQALGAAGEMPPGASKRVRAVIRPKEKKAAPAAAPASGLPMGKALSVTPPAPAAP